MEVLKQVLEREERKQQVRQGTGKVETLISACSDTGEGINKAEGSDSLGIRCQGTHSQKDW